MKTNILIGVVLLFSIFLVSASINDIKPTVCNSLNMTEPNCTNWWNTLGLTDANLTNVTIFYTINNITANNYSITNITNITNVTYMGNYTIYNITNNITILRDVNGSNYTMENYYNKSQAILEIDNRIPNMGDYVSRPELDGYVPRGEIDILINQTMQNSDLSYVVKTVNDIGTAWKVWLWIIGIVVLILVCAVGYLIFMSLNG